MPGSYFDSQSSEIPFIKAQFFQKQLNLVRHVIYELIFVIFLQPECASFVTGDYQFFGIQSQFPSMGMYSCIDDAGNKGSCKRVPETAITGNRPCVQPEPVFENRKLPF